MSLDVEIVKELLKGHEDRKSAADDMELFRRSYVGGSEYRDGKYLTRHEKEKRASFKRRLSEAVYTNYCAPVIDIFSSYLYRERPQRHLGSTSSSLKEFTEDADLMGRSFAELSQEVERWAAVYGHMGVIVDKPMSGDEATLGEELANHIRPYVTYYTPAGIVNWRFSAEIYGPPFLSLLVLRENEIEEGIHRYKIWTRDAWELWATTKNAKGEEEPVLLAEGVNVLGTIPFTLVVNKDSFDEMSGISDLGDIAEINRYIYRIDSLAYEVIAGTAFPFLEVPMDNLAGTSNSDVVVGTSNVLERDISDAVGHRWIEPAHQSLTRIMEWRVQAVNDIHEIAKMGTGSAARRQGSAAFSGVAMEVKFQQLNAILAAKATAMERAETSILKFVLMWEKLPTEDVYVRYPRKFGIRDVVTDLDTALRAKDVIHSPEYDNLIQKSLASRSLSDLGYSSADIKRVEQDIEKQPYVPSANELHNTGGPNGVSVVQTTTAVQDAQKSAQVTDGSTN